MDMSNLEELGEEQPQPLTTLSEEGEVSLQVLAVTALTQLALQLAERAGEATPRPLTEAQLDRAWQVMRAERNTLMRLIGRDLEWPPS
jgi:hypothetical protein